MGSTASLKTKQTMFLFRFCRIDSVGRLRVVKLGKGGIKLGKKDGGRDYRERDWKWGELDRDVGT